MNLWDIFFTTQATEPPKFDLFWYVSLFTLLALTFYPKSFIPLSTRCNLQNP